MSEFINKSNTGAIFENDKKGNDRAPDKIGKFTDENGVIKKIAIWSNTSKNGLKYESFIISDFTSSNTLALKTNGLKKEDSNGINVMPF